MNIQLQFREAYWNSNNYPEVAGIKSRDILIFDTCTGQIKTGHYHLNKCFYVVDDSGSVALFSNHSEHNHKNIVRWCYPCEYIYV